MAYTTVNKSKDYFEPKLYAGTSGTVNVTGLNFQPDWCWLKNRSVTNRHALFDAIRGVTYRMATDQTEASVADADTLTNFNSDGFTVGADAGSYGANKNGSNFVSWNWKANGAGSSNSDGTITTTTSASSISGFSIIKFTGTGSGGATIGHGLSKKPKGIVIKRTSSTGNWVYWQDTTNNGTSDVRLLFNSTNGNYNNYHVTFGTNTVTLPSTSDPAWSGSGSEYIAYCFADITGYSKFGSYTGNGSADGPFIYTGFKPAFTILKKSSSSGNRWVINDSKRSPSNVVNKSLFADSNSGDTTTSQEIDYLSNGFKLRTTSSNHNTSGHTYIYMAFAEAPLVGTNNVPCNAK